MIISFEEIAKKLKYLEPAKTTPTYFIVPIFIGPINFFMWSPLMRRHLFNGCCIFQPAFGCRTLQMLVEKVIFSDIQQMLVDLL